MQTGDSDEWLENGDAKLTLPFDYIDRALLPIAGGKATNLGELICAGLPVSAGFCMTTATYELMPIASA